MKKRWCDISWLFKQTVIDREISTAARRSNFTRQQLASTGILHWRIERER
jgi:hypothetical protein